MFRTNTNHRQGHLFSTLDELSPGVREMLENSWAGTFRREVFSRLDEQPFAVLYSATGSRPNVAVNVLVGLEILKAGHGWTDEEMYHEFLLNLQVRYAVGYENLSDGYFAIRTVYHFRNALSRHMQETGENLLDRAFSQVTDEQVAAFALKTGKLRMDSTQIASDIRQYSRLQLLVEVLQRVQRMLCAADQARYALLLAPYCEGKSSHYVYRLQSREYESHLVTIGAVMHGVVTDLAADYGDAESYQILRRVFHEHFLVTSDDVQLLPAKAMSGATLQSPDDPEATFRTKQGASYRGYVANVTETCDPDNAFQLVVKTQTEANVTDDAAMMADLLPELAARTDVDTICTDGGYNGPAVDPLLDAYHIDHIQTAIRGGKPDPDQVSIAAFTFAFNADDLPVQATCPQGQTFPIEPGRHPGRLIGRPAANTCNACPLLARCQVRPQRGNQQPTLYLEERRLRLAVKRLRLHTLPDHLRNLRPAVEATVRSIKHPFRQGRILVRGKFRIACTIIASAFMVNARRIHLALQRIPLANIPLPAWQLSHRPATWFTTLSLSLGHLWPYSQPAYPLRILNLCCLLQRPPPPFPLQTSPLTFCSRVNHRSNNQSPLDHKIL